MHLQPLTALTSWRNPTTTQSQNLRVLPETQALRGKLNLPHLPARHTCHEHREQDVFDTVCGSRLDIGFTGSKSEALRP